MRVNKAELKEVLTALLNELHPMPSTLRKARVIKNYKTGSKYLCDVEILNNDETVDINFPIISKINIPVIIAGDGRGIIAPPEINSLCDISFYNGDINYPVVSNFRLTKACPPAEAGELNIANSKDVFLKMKKDGTLNIKSKKVEVECDDAKVKSTSVLIDSSDINLGGENGMALVTQDCPCQFTGSPHAKFTLKVKGV